MRKYAVDDNKNNDEDPSKYKDFGKLLTNYEDTLKRVHRKPLYKDPKAFIILLMFILLLLLVLDAVDEEKEKENEPPSTELPIDGNPAPQQP